ncbi:MAG: YceI family protein [Myxococcaceae bacterium]|nr:YceI family protein [Myxococcaceae bacterium]
MATWNIDTSHSEVGFWVRHLMVTKVRGQFKQWQGSMTIDGDDLSTAKIRAEVQIDSIDTREAKRDGHLKSPDFFDAANHATMRFESSALALKGDRGTLAGTLTIRGVSKPVTFEVTALGRAKDPWGGQRWAFEASTVINRKDFGLNWNQALEAGGVLVGDEVHIDVQAQLVAA